MTDRNASSTATLPGSSKTSIALGGGLDRLDVVPCLGEKATAILPLRECPVVMAEPVAEPQPEALFYHLEQQPLERILPGLVERSLERGWRAVVEAGNGERVTALDTLLWTYREDGFLPHGTAADGHLPEQPVFLTEGDSNPNGAVIRFLVDGASATPATWSGPLRAYRRVVVIFDGNDADAVASARAQWRSAKEAGFVISYWQQSGEGRWERKA